MSESALVLYYEFKESGYLDSDEESRSARLTMQNPKTVILELKERNAQLLRKSEHTTCTQWTIPVEKLIELVQKHGSKVR